MDANEVPTGTLPTTGLSAERCQSLLAAFVAPRPIAWISTRSPGGCCNLAPFSSFAAICARPPMISVSIGSRDGRPKDTLANLLATGAFCVNRVTEPLLPAMLATAGDFAPDRCEFEVAGVTVAAATLVDAPCVREAPSVLECTLFRALTLPAGFTLVLGRVVGFRVDAATRELGAVGAPGHFDADGYVIVRDS